MKGLLEVYKQGGPFGWLVTSEDDGVAFLKTHLVNWEPVWESFKNQNEDGVLWPNVIIVLGAV